MIFSIIRKFLKITLLLTPSSSKLKIHYFIYYFNQDKENELFKIKKFIAKKGNAIDIGCNKGLYSYAFSKQKKIQEAIMLRTIPLGF